MWSDLRSLRLALAACGLILSASLAHGSDRGQAVTMLTDAVHRLASRYDTFAMVPNDSQGRVVYGTNRGYLHLLRPVGSRYREIWVSPSHTARIEKVIVADLEGSGSYQIVAYNVRGWILVYDVDTFGLVWKSPEQQFRSIDALTVGNVDADPQQEIIFLSEGRLYFYDGLHFIEEWRSDIVYNARDLVVGDVDGDGQPEVVLGSGHVLDPRFRTIKWESQEPFGTHLELADIDGDGKMELIAGTNETVRIWDLDERREKWE